MRLTRATSSSSSIHSARIGWWPRLTRAIVRLLLGHLFRLKLIGTPPREGGYLLVANHQGWVDAFVLIALFPATPRLHFIGDRRATMTAWWKRAILSSLGVVVPVNRDSTSERDAIERAVELLKRGAVVGIFPEGRVSHAEASLGPLQRGVGYLASKAQAPVLPVWLRGTAELYLQRELSVTIGRLRLPTNSLTKEATRAYADQIHADLRALAAPWIEPTGPKRMRWLTSIL